MQPKTAADFSSTFFAHSAALPLAYDKLQRLYYISLLYRNFVGNFFLENRMPSSKLVEHMCGKWEMLAAPMVLIHPKTCWERTRAPIVDRTQLKDTRPIPLSMLLLDSSNTCTHFGWSNVRVANTIIDPDETLEYNHIIKVRKMLLATERSQTDKYIKPTHFIRCAMCCSYSVPLSSSEAVGKTH